jgi:hypothetical protein
VEGSTPDEVRGTREIRMRAVGDGGAGVRVSIVAFLISMVCWMSILRIAFVGVDETAVSGREGARSRVAGNVARMT